MIENKGLAAAKAALFAHKIVSAKTRARSRKKVLSEAAKAAAKVAMSFSCVVGSGDRRQNNLTKRKS